MRRQAQVASLTSASPARVIGCHAFSPKVRAAEGWDVTRGNPEGLWQAALL